MGEARQKRIARAAADAAADAAVAARGCRYGDGYDCTRPARLRPYDIEACDHHWHLLESMTPEAEWEEWQAET